MPKDAARPGPEPTNEIVLMKSLAVSPAPGSHARLRAMLSEKKPTELPKLSHRFRRSWSNHWRPYDDLDPAQALELLGASTDLAASASALSMHHNGHVRQLATTTLIDFADPLVLPFVLLRCGDWVDEVRRPALEAIEPWISVDRIDTILRSYRLLAGERFSPGRPPQHLPARFAALLDSPPAQRALLHHVTSTDPIVRRTAVRLLLKNGPTIQLLERAATTDDPVAIGLTARSLPTDGEVNEATSAILIRQTSPRLRQEGLFRILKAGGSEAEAAAQRFMLDRATSVRSTAQRWFDANGRNVPAFYRALGPSERLEALLGLGDRADPDDAALARASLDERPAIRRAALRLLSPLGDRTDYETFAACLLHGSEREARAALAWFRRSGMAKEALMSMWASATTDEAAIRIVLRLAPLTDMSSQLELALRSCVHPQRAVRDAGILLARRASTRADGFLTPSADRLAALRVLVEPARAELAAAPVRYGRPNLAEHIDHLLRER